MDRPKIAATLVAAGLCAHAFFVPLSIAGMQIALGVAALGLALQPPRPLRSPLDWPAAAFVAVCIVSDLVSPVGPPSLAFATLWRSVLGFFVVFHGLRALDQSWPPRLIACACAGLAIGAITGLVQYRTGVDPVHLLGLRPQAAIVEAPGVPGRFGAMGFFISRLTFGHNAAVLVSFLAGALASRALPGRLALFAGATALLGLAAIAVTFDRAGYLGLCAAALVIALFGAQRRVVLPALAALLLAAALHPGVRERFRSSFSTEGKGNADRIFLWQRAGEIIRDHPLRGVGFGNYQRVLDPYYNRADPAFPMRTWAHNLELTALAETGPLGLAALLWLFGAAALALYRKRALGGLAALLALFAFAQFHDVLYDTKVMYALWLALALSLAGAERTRSE